MPAKSDLHLIYEGARDLFLRGQHDRALDRFQSIYEIDVTFRDVTEIVNDYYNTAKREWVAKYQSRFQQQHGKD